MSPRRPPLSLVTLLGLLILVTTSLIGCDSSETSDQSVKPDPAMTKRGGSGPAKHDSPQAAFDTAQAAWMTKDYEAFFDCLTPEVQDAVAGGMIFNAACMMASRERVGAPGEEDSEAQELEDGCRRLGEVLAKHGVGTGQMKSIRAMAEADPAASPEEMKAALAKLTTPIKDKRAFFVEMKNVAQATELAVTGENNTRDDPWWHATLENIKCKGDRATAQVVFTSDGEQKRNPMVFKKVNGNWLIDGKVWKPKDNGNASVDGQAPHDEAYRRLDLGRGVVMLFERIPAGSFQMGSPSGESGRYEYAGPQHRVTITKPYYLGKTEVTQAQWKAVMGRNPSNFKKGGDYPVEQVSWDNCQKFIDKLNAKYPGRQFCLPTEAEWEYACRAGTQGARYGDLDRIAWYGKNSGDSTHRVGTKQANAWKLHDMIGNVGEWCADGFGEYSAGAVTNPTEPRRGPFRVSRGGSWFSDSGECSASRRLKCHRLDRDDRLGFRLASSSP